MRTVWLAIGAVLVIVGAVWIFQGIGALKGSFMTGSSFWGWMGLVAVAAGIPALARGLRRGSRRPRG